MLSKFKENRKKIVVVFVCLMAVIIAVTVGVFVYRNSDKVKVKNYLEMGSRYLSEMQYEQAIVEFTKAFELDPDNPVVTGNLVTAYSDWADALVEEENYDKAIEILTQGYELTGDESLNAQITEIRDSVEAEKAKKAKERFDELARNIRLEMDEIYTETDGSSVYRTFDERAAVYAPVINDLNEYVDLIIEHPDFISEKLNFEVFYDSDIRGIAMTFDMMGVDAVIVGPDVIYTALASLYLHIGDYESCLDARSKLAEYTGDDSILTEHSTSDAAFNRIYDKYGRMLHWESKDTGANPEDRSYSDASGDYITSLQRYDGFFEKAEFDNGRIVSLDDPTCIYTYSYSGDTVTATVVKHDTGYTFTKQFRINKYGKEIEGSSVEQ